MNETESRLLDAKGMEDLLETMARRIAERRSEGSPLRLVGIHTRGVPIARRLAERLRPIVGGEVPVGAVDITLYRDDLGGGDRWPVLRGTEIPFAVEGAEIVLVDDVTAGRRRRWSLSRLSRSLPSQPQSPSGIRRGATIRIRRRTPPR